MYPYSSLLAVLLTLGLTVHSSEGQDTFECNICGPGFQIGNEEGIITPEGRENRTCAELQAFGDEGLISEDQCAELGLYVQEPCECQPFVCSICGVDGITTNPGGVIDIPYDTEGLTTCAAVQAVAEDGGYNETFCDTVQSLALVPCGCEVGGGSSPTRAPVPGSSIRPSPPTTAGSLPTATPIIPKDGATVRGAGWKMVGVIVPAFFVALFSW
jgi:hypothetical protein